MKALSQRFLLLSPLIGLLVRSAVSGAGVVLLPGCQRPPQAVSRPDADWSVRHVLMSADQVNIGKVNNGVKYAFTILADGNNPKMFALLKQSGRFHVTPPKAKPDFIFDVPFAEGKVYHSVSGQYSMPTYEYVSETGELGTGNDWCYVPERFRSWVLASKAQTPVPHFQ